MSEEVGCAHMHTAYFISHEPTTYLQYNTIISTDGFEGIHLNIWIVLKLGFKQYGFYSDNSLSVTFSYK